MVEKMLSIDPTGAPLFGENRTLRAKTIAASLDLAQSKGKLTAPMRACFEKILSVRHGYALSATGVAEGVDIAAVADSLLAAIPDNSAVPLGDALKGASGTDRPANDAPKFDTKTEVSNMLSLAGYAKK